MGGVLDKLNTKGGGQQVFIDFENAAPSNEEQATYTLVKEVLDRSEEINAVIEQYKGCQALAKEAMQNPTPENEQEAFDGLLLAVESISTFYSYSKDLEKILPELLSALGKPSQGGSDEQKTQADGKEALYKQLADVFNFTLEFDNVRMQRPNLSNDFSYYRRLLPKFNKHPDVKVKDDEASGMALFTAEYIPMMNCLARAAAKAAEKNESTTMVLSVMANSCCKMIKSKRFDNPDTNLFCARAMAGAIVLFDHVDLLGVFHRKSSIPIKPCVNMLKKEFPKETALINAIHFSTKHFKDAPQSVQDLFD
jgi:hypothetical protein